MSQPEEIVITDPPGLAECCARLAQTAHVGFDTEFVGEDTYEPDLCLIQVSTRDALYLIDPLSSGPLDAFWPLLVEPARTVVVHAGREEACLCQRATGKAPTNWFDLQIAAGLVGLNFPMGHGSLVREVLGHQLDKHDTLTEWRRRPLSPSQLEYAFDDVRYLLQIWQNLEQRLRARGRSEWAKQEFARFIAQATPDATQQRMSTDKWRKLRGAGSLDRRRLGMLRELFLAREAVAAQLNRPPRVLVRDDLLVEIARRNPKAPGEIQVMRGMARRFVQPLYEAIERVRAMPVEQLPVPTEREQDPPQLALVVQVLTAILNDFCTRGQLAMNLTATTGDVRELVRARMQKESVAPTNPLMSGWRQELVLPLLLAVLEGKRSVRIADLDSETPFQLE